MTKENFESAIKARLSDKENINVNDVIELAYKIHAEATDIVWSIVSDRDKQLFLNGYSGVRFPGRNKDRKVNSTLTCW